jgi:uncharacterized cofD-like protein
MSGGFAAGVEQAGRFLRVKGRVLPAATESLTLLVHYDDGTVSEGESTVREPGRAVRSVAAVPEGIPAPEAVLAAIHDADLIVLGPGSLFTSTIAALLGGGVREALAGFAGPVVYVANLMTQPGESERLSAADHVRAIGRHVGPVVTDVLVDARAVPPEVERRYREEGAEPVRIDREALAELDVRLHEAPLHHQTPGRELRHDPRRLAEAVLAVAAPRA